MTTRREQEVIARIEADAARARTLAIRDALAEVGVRFGLPLLPWAKEIANNLTNQLDEARHAGLRPFDVCLAAVMTRRTQWQLPISTERTVPFATELAETWARLTAKESPNG